MLFPTHIETVDSRGEAGYIYNDMNVYIYGTLRDNVVGRQTGSIYHRIPSNERLEVRNAANT